MKENRSHAAQSPIREHYEGKSEERSRKRHKEKDRISSRSPDKETLQVMLRGHIQTLGKGADYGIT